jgi:hypothetical protein
MLNQIVTRIDSLRASRAARRSRYPDARAAIPPALYPTWKRLAPLEFEGIRTDAFFFACAVEGLLTFFDCVRRSEQRCALPSKAADSVWHVWIRMNLPGLDAFTTRYFGGPIPHVEGAAMDDLPSALANCLVQARRAEGMPSASSGLPDLFLLDRRLRMPTGFGYRAFGERLGFCALDGGGRPSGLYAFPAALATLALLESGMISQAEFELQRKRMQDQGGTDGSFSVGTSIGCADSGGSASDCGGASCGSGCGGGCGGGS